MPITRSKAQRRAANRTALHTNARLVGAQRQGAKAAIVAEQLYNERAHLAKILAFVIANNGGELVIPKAALEHLPTGASLQQMYDRDSESFRFVTVVTEADETPAVEVVQPKIEIVR